MTPEQAIVVRIGQLLTAKSYTGVAVYTDRLPQAPAYPVVRVSLIGETAEYILQGSTRYKRAVVQVDVFAQVQSGVDPYADATELAAALDGTTLSGPGLSGWVGTLDGDGSPARPFQILGVFRTDRRRQYDPDELQVVTVQQDYDVHYRPE